MVEGVFKLQSILYVNLKRGKSYHKGLGNIPFFFYYEMKSFSKVLYIHVSNRIFLTQLEERLPKHGRCYF